LFSGENGGKRVENVSVAPPLPVELASDMDPKSSLRNVIIVL
jgi:hypothetical protein